MYTSVFAIALLAASTIAPAFSTPLAISNVQVARRYESPLAARVPDTPTLVKIRSEDVAAALHRREELCDVNAGCVQVQIRCVCG
ncbi:hypothetical protein EI94DRAFT_1751629 [Lactarius quietus]|nr:hypothetical protein EI94DRAFT_1751629 [Lactarius quietus]